MNTNAAYGLAAYSKGAVLMAKLSYIVGQKTLDKALRKYYHVWKYKHPYPRDFKHVTERVTGTQLDWYFNLFVNTTRTIDYAIKSIDFGEDSTKITIEREGTPLCRLM